MSTMIERNKERLVRVLRWSEKYTKTDMVYFTSGGSWLLVGQFSAIVVSLISSVAFGHFATQDTYGNYRYAIVIAGLLSTFTLSGVGTGVIQSISRGYEGALKQGFGLNLRWSASVVILSLAAAVYYGVVEHNAFLVAALCLIGILYPFINSFSLYDSLFTAKRQFKRSTLFGILNNALPILAVITTLAFSQRAIILIIVFLGTSLAMDAFCYRVALREVENDIKDPELFRYSAHLSVMGIINAIADKIDSIVIFNLLGPSQLAVYAYAIAIPEQIKQLVKQITPLSMARFSQRDIREIRHTIWHRIWVFVFAVSAMLILYILIAPWVFKFLFPVYTDAILYSRWYALSIALTIISTPLMSIFQAHKNTKDMYIVSNGSSILLIVLLPVLSFLYGIPGAILAQFAYRASMAALAAWRFALLKD
jgi:O-antigen/teichoic acid export membrane protein